MKTKARACEQSPARSLLSFLEDEVETTVSEKASDGGDFLIRIDLALIGRS